MELLPCEILQHVASSLLPRSQCRFAMTSRQNYDWLYSPLLRWCAKRALIPAPKSTIYHLTKDGGSSVYHVNNCVVVYRTANNERRSCIFVENFTKRQRVRIFAGAPIVIIIGKINKTTMVDYIDAYIESMPKYIIPLAHRKVVKLYSQSRSQFIGLPSDVLRNIFGQLSEEDRVNYHQSSYYLSTKTAFL